MNTNTNNRYQMIARAVIASLTLAASSSVFAVNNSDTLLKDVKDVPNVSKAFNDGNVGVSFRGRLESVNDKAQLTTSGGRVSGEAYTLKTNLKYNTAFWNDVALALDFVHVGSYFDDRHNQGQNLTPRTNDRPVIADPSGNTLNQAYVVHKGVPDTVITLGRQHLSLDNNRFVGTEYFRQMPTSFDALTLTNNTYKDWQAFYAFVDRINTNYKGSNSFTGQEHNHESHLFNLTWSGMPYGEVTGFAYLIEDKTAPANSADLYGASFNGDTPMGDSKVLYTAAYARQDAGHNNPKSYVLNYLNLGAGVSANAVSVIDVPKLMVNYEVIGGKPEQSVGFTMPLGAAHGFNGLADKFSTVPNNGLRDLSVALTGGWQGVDASAAYHHFSAEERGSLATKGYGEEWDFTVSKTLRDRYTFGVEYADFNAKGGSAYANVNKIWFTASAKFM